MQRAVRWGLVVLVGLVSVGWPGAAPASSINTYPQVNSKTLSSGKDTLEWGDRYQINVCDSHHKWSSMTLWVRESKTSSWHKIGRTKKVNDTWKWDGAAWTQIVTPGPSPARGFAPMAYDESLRDRIAWRAVIRAHLPERYRWCR